MRELRERAASALRIVCFVLAAVIIYELAGMAARLNPFRGVTVPELPALGSATNSLAAGPKGTNEVAGAKGRGTNASPASATTNLAGSATHPATNPPAAAAATPGTSLATSATNLAAPGKLTAAGTNPPVAAEADATTNLSSNGTVLAATNLVASNTVASISNMTNVAGTNPAALTGSGTNNGTNLAVATPAGGTNPAAGTKPKRKKSGGGAMPDFGGMGGGPGQPGQGVVELPPAVKNRISQVTESEILGPVIRTLPMGLLGIAGQVAFLRADSGQTGLVKEGDSLDDIKLLKIGLNRVLIEQKGEKKELTIFSGYGSESLLQTETTNENKHL